MPNVEIKMVFNPDTEEVQTLIDGEVLVASGADTFKSWVDYYNEKHKPAPPVQEPVEEKKVDVTPEATPSAAETVVEQVPEEVETQSQTEVDRPTGPVVD